MALDPRLQPFVDAASSQPPPAAELTVEERRSLAHEGIMQTMLLLCPPCPPVASTQDHRVPVEGGEIVVRVYTPEGAGPFPLHVYLHGGGFWIGKVDQFDGECCACAVGAGCVVASVDYRLAPEHRFPTAPEDCWSALCWLVEHAAELGVDTSRISVGGASAGGCLAAVLTLMARDRGGPSLTRQVLEIPVTDLTMSQPSIVENGAGYMLTRDAITQYVGYYLTDPADATNPYASPLLAEDLTGLPPALIMTAECDPLRDEGEAYARRLEDAGVPVTLKRWDGQLHGSQNFAAIIPEEAAEYRAMIVAFLRS